MRVFTPQEVAEPAMSKYLGVLIAAKYARELNAMPREAMPMDEKKLTTKALEALTSTTSSTGCSSGATARNSREEA